MMGENGVTNVSEKKSLFTVKRVMQVLALLCIIFVFCPSFLVSCSGQEMKVNVMTAVGGVSMYGEKVVEPHIIMIVCLLIPIAVLVLLFIKKFADKQNAAIILGCTALDFVIWLIFRSAVKKMAEENYCSFKTTAWYVINMIVMVFIIVLSVLVVMCKLELETDLIAVFSGGGTQDALKQMSNTVNQMSNTVTKLAGNVATNINNNKVKKENAIGFCAKCGSPISYGSKFCTSCGTPVPESMLAEAEAARKAAQEAEAEAARKAAQEAEAEAARKAAQEAEAKAAQEAEAAQRAAQEAEAARQAAQKTETAQNTVQGTEPTLFCQNCGAKLTEGTAFCTQCGKEVKH